MEYKEWNCKLSKIEKFSVEHCYLWDLGFIKLTGSEDFPERIATSYESFSWVLQNHNTGFEDIEEDCHTKKLDIYIGDYVLYVPTSLSNAEFLLDDETLYSVEGRDMVKDGVSHFYLREKNTLEHKKELFEEKDIQCMTPLMSIAFS